MSVKATVTIELNGITHNMSIDDARDLWISLGEVLNPIKKETPKDPAPKITGLPPGFWGGIQPCNTDKEPQVVPLSAFQLQTQDYKGDWSSPLAPYLC